MMIELFIFLTALLFAIFVLASVFLVEQLLWYASFKEWRSAIACIEEPDTIYGAAGLAAAAISLLVSLLMLSILITKNIT